MKMKCGVCFLVVLVLFCNVCCAETLTVSVCFDEYFAPPDNADDPNPDPNVIYYETPEYAALKEFQELHPDCEVKIIVNAPVEEKSEADVFLLSGSLTDIHKVINSPYVQSIQAYLPKDTVTNVLCLDKLVNKNNELVAVPIYAWAFAVYPNGEMISFLPEQDQTILLDSLKSWDDIYVFGSKLKKEGFASYVIAGLPYMACQLLGLTQNAPGSFENVKGQITDLLDLWKKMAKEGILEVPKTFEKLSFEVSRNSLLNFDIAYVYDIQEAMTGIKTEYPFYPVPMCGLSFQSPLRMEVGVVSSSCDNIPLAAEFLSAFTTMENQKMFAHSGIIRSDLYAYMKEEKEIDSVWYKDQESWWGELIPEESYALYNKTVCEGFIPSITDAQLLLFAWDVADYINDKVSVTKIIDWLEEYYVQY